MKISGQNISTDILRQNILEKANEAFSGNKKTEEVSKKINDAINSVAESQNKASQITKDYELGKETDLTKVIMQQQISNIAFQKHLNSNLEIDLIDKMKFESMSLGKVKSDINEAEPILRDSNLISFDIKSIKKKYRNQFLDYHDKRTSKIIEGYLLQAIFYYITGDPFCKNLDCRLNNAHWQKDLLYSQLEFGRLCDKHHLILEKLHL